MGETDPGSSPFPPEVLISMAADPRNLQPGGWIHEAEYKDRIQVMIQDEKVKGGGKSVDFTGETVPFARQVKTSLESVEDLFPANLTRLATSPTARNETRGLVPQTPEIDQNRLLSFLEEGELRSESDEDLARDMETFGRKRAHRAGDRMEQFLDHTRHDIDRRPMQLPTETTVTASTGTNPPQSPHPSTELDCVGIRDAGDYGPADEDAFHIPLEFASDVAMKRPEPPTGRSEPNGKKRKLTQSESPAMVHPLQQLPGIHTVPPLHPTVEGSSEHAGPSNGSYTQLPYNLVRNEPSPAPPRRLTRGIENRTLSVPVGKDPRDPNPMLTCSQRRSSPTNSTQDSNAESSSFPSSAEHGLRALGPKDAGPFPSALPPRTQPPRAPKCLSKIHRAFGIGDRKTLLGLTRAPPRPSEIIPEMQAFGLPSKIYPTAHYGNEKDVPNRAREYGGKQFRLEGTTVPFLPDFDPHGTSAASLGQKASVPVDTNAEGKASRRRGACGLRVWEFREPPPTKEEVQAWLHEQGAKDLHVLGTVSTDMLAANGDLSQIQGATQRNRHGFEYSQDQKSTGLPHLTHYMSIMSLEIHVNTRGSLVPNPEQDEIGCVFWCLQSDDEGLEVNGINEGTHVGVLALSEAGGLAQKISQQTCVEVEEENSELDLINRMVDIVRGYDPDILTGYEVHGGSWGYVIERARCKYDYNLCDEFSRMKSPSHGRFANEDDRWGFNHTSTVRVTGRHTINIWRTMKGELNLLQYTMENVVFQLCHRRIPHYSFQDLTSWYTSGNPNDLAKVVDYYLSRVQLDLEILEQNELVPRTSEQARLLGVDFFSVFARGSQFKVESLMFRIAKPESFILPSPSRKQVGQQNALECLPLVMEPQSAFYNSPLLVLDFQSLYPSVMIAYNYCYSTFLGTVVGRRGQNKMGFTDYPREPRLLELFHNQINVAPNGMMYAKPEIRRSLLAKMLGEILETRVMVKSGMKVDQDDKNLQRLLNNRQLALKLIANVTYGYTSASFSGRMPCSEIADSIVQTGRETLERAIALIHSVDRWGAEVVYGDTDSLFVYLKGRTKDEAFDIGQEIAKTITDTNPSPVKLKFEKVYLPCVLLAKKRYVGFKFESKNQTVPDFDAKGIETVRRDGTPAEQKIEEKALKILFRSADLSRVKNYFQQQCRKIMKGTVSIQDFCFAKEVKLGTYSDKGLPPPGALISTKRMLEDPRAEPQYGERVPYVVVSGAPGARLIDRCIAPDTLLHHDYHELDAEYYISKNIIPPLERIFNLVGANVRQWYDEMPKFQRVRRIEAGASTAGKDLIVSKTLESYMKSSSCIVCHEKLEEEAVICASCMQHADISLLTLNSRLNKAEKKAVSLEKVCRSCAGLVWGEEIKCDSKDCPVFYTRTRHVAGLRSTTGFIRPVIGVLEELRSADLDW